MTDTRESLDKSIEELRAAALSLFDELQRDPAAYDKHMGKAGALRRLLSVQQREVRNKLAELKGDTTTAMKRQMEKLNG